MNQKFTIRITLNSHWLGYLWIENLSQIRSQGRLGLSRINCERFATNKIQYIFRIVSK